MGGVGVGDGAEGALTDGGGSAEAGEECRFTIVMGDRHVGSGGYQKPWRLYRLQAGSASDRDAWLGCIRGGMARYREHGPWALRPRNPPAAAQAVVSATVARTLTRPDSKHRARLGPKGAVARTAGGATGTPRAAGAAADDGVSDGTATASTLPFYRRPYTRYIRKQGSQIFFSKLVREAVDGGHSAPELGLFRQNFSEFTRSGNSTAGLGDVERD